MSQESELVAGMMYRDAVKRRANMRFTVLTRGELSQGMWHSSEVGRIINGLRTEAYQLPSMPQLVILFGEFTKAQVLEAMVGGCTFTAETVIGLDNERLPFRPSM